MIITCPNGMSFDEDGSPSLESGGERLQIVDGTCIASGICPVPVNKCEYKETDKEKFKLLLRKALIKDELNDHVEDAEERRKSDLYERFHSKGLRVIK